MANNATNVWKWVGGASAEWRAANWTDGDDTAVDDFPDAAADTVTMVDHTTNAMATCSEATEVGTITQGAAYEGAVCVENLTAATVNATAGGSGTITGGTIATLNAGSDTEMSGGAVTVGNFSGTSRQSGGTVATANMGGSSVVSGGVIATLLTWNSAGTEIYGTFPATVRAYQNIEFDGGDSTFDATATTIYVMRRGATVTFDLDTHTYAGNPVVDTTYAYGYPKEQ